MWRCENCGEEVEDTFDACWKCASKPLGLEGNAVNTEETASTASRVTFKLFRAGSLTSWEAVFSEAAAFASKIAPDDLIGISHSSDNHYGVVAVWYRTRDQGDSEDLM